MKYDLSIVINKNIEDILSISKKYFNNTKRLSTVISKILNLSYPLLKKYHFFCKEDLPKYERINWTRKIHLNIDYKVYLILKKIYEDTNGYSMAYIVRRLIEFFVNRSRNFENINEYTLWLIKYCKNRVKRKIKNPLDVWSGTKKLGSMRFDGKKREFPIMKPYITIKYNEYYRPIEFLLE